MAVHDPDRRRATRRGFLVGAPLALFLAGCGAGEPEQRAAFIAFLKARIVDKPGLHLPIPTDEERKSFGPYAAQFDLIADFNKALDAASAETMGKFADLTRSAHSIDAILARKDEIVGLGGAVDRFADALKAKLAAAEAARAALPPQPDDLKPVYAAAFERDVTGPAAAFLEASPALKSALAALVDVAAFVERHKSALTISGSTVQASDPKLVAPLNDLMKAVAESAARVNEQMQKLQKVMNGG